MRMHWSMRGGGDRGFVKGREEEMSTDARYICRCRLF